MKKVGKTEKRAILLSKLKDQKSQVKMLEEEKDKDPQKMFLLKEKPISAAQVVNLEKKDPLKREPTQVVEANKKANNLEETQKMSRGFLCQAVHQTEHSEELE
jgi:hypothetical protein